MRWVEPYNEKETSSKKRQIKKERVGSKKEIRLKRQSEKR